MCGIAGILELRGQAPPSHVLRLMARRLRHRGPDGHGIYADGPCALVHTRLAILDPERGQQPLTSQREEVWITFNGEIYNSPRLRRDLEARGSRFRTTTDTEVIVALYEEDPEGFVERLEGIFAFALWDTRRRQLVLARDYMGVKPLYLYEGPDALIFGSEVKALLADARVPCAADPRGLVEILSFQNTYGSRTCFRDIRLLEGGHVLTVRADGRRQERRYWSFRQTECPMELPRLEAAGRLRELCETVIREQLLSDVPVAAYLSGGMDTGILTAVASRHLPRLLTFSGGFQLEGVPAENRGVDEREAARLMSRNFGTLHHFHEITPQELAASFARIAWHLEEPRGSTCYAPWAMARAVAVHGKVILSGHGGDELFAGYRARYDIARQHNADWESYWFGALNYLVPQAQAADWLHPDFASPELLAWPRQAYADFVCASRGLSPLARSQHHDLFVYMQGLLLIEDKLSMAHGLESRVPLLDRRLFDFAWALPDDWKLGPGRGKLLLREAFQGALPDTILARDKMGFGPPDEHYYRTHLRSFFEGLLLDGSLAGRHIIKPEVVRDVLFRQRRGEPLAGLLWTLASVEMWHRTFLDRAHALRARADDDVDVGPVPHPSGRGRLRSLWTACQRLWRQSA